jgi:multiple sugar transport system permease protein
MIPFRAILTPQFIQLNAVRLTDRLLGLILFYSTVNLPFGVFVMRTAFSSIPGELEEAARIDGAGTPRTFAHLWPLVLPGLATTALYAFLASWTEFLGALTSPLAKTCSPSQCPWSTCSRAPTASSTTASSPPARSSP